MMGIFANKSELLPCVPSIPASPTTCWCFQLNVFGNRPRHVTIATVKAATLKTISVYQ